ncbi:methionine ABC transporter permease, partial [Klebsiella pneumoniae]
GNDLPARPAADDPHRGDLRRQLAQLSEAMPALVAAVTLNLVSMIEYSAIAGTIGAGGIGYLAVVYGYQRFDNHIMIATIVALIATIQLIQFLGDRLVNRLRHTQGNLV